MESHLVVNLACQLYIQDIDSGQLLTVYLIKKVTF